MITVDLSKETIEQRLRRATAAMGNKRFKMCHLVEYLPVTWLHKEAGLNYNTFRIRLAQPWKFTHEQICQLALILNVRPDRLFNIIALEYDLGKRLLERAAKTR
jgi:hypothetical protein